MERLARCHRSNRACGARLANGGFSKHHSRRVSANIHIDHRHHMEIAWKRQMKLEAEIADELQAGPDGVVWEVRDLAHLEKIHQVAGGRVVVMLAYNRSCGCCKKAIAFLRNMSKQGAASRAGIVHCKHDTVNEFDFPSDVARMHGIKHVPSFLIFHSGALVDRLILPDSRAGAHGPSRQIEQILEMAMQQVQGRVRKHVFRKAPSASSEVPPSPPGLDTVF